MNYSLTRSRTQDPFYSLLNELMAPAQAAETTYEPAFEAKEEEGHYLLTVDLPGAAKKDIKLEVLERSITVGAERQRDGMKWQRTFNFAQKLDPDQIEADYRDGVLSIYLPKHAATKPRAITIQGAEHQEQGFFGKLFAKKTETQAA